LIFYLRNALGAAIGDVEVVPGPGQRDEQQAAFALHVLGVCDRVQFDRAATPIACGSMP